jgi:hypothetical protein
MSATQSFWSVPQRDEESLYWVCMSCLSEVFYRKVPMPIARRATAFRPMRLSRLRRFVIGAQRMG